MTLNLLAPATDDLAMDASAYAFVRGIRATRTTLSEWNRRPWPVLASWLVGSLAAALALLAAVWAIGTIAPGRGAISLGRPPLVVGDWLDVARILYRNSLVLALHAIPELVALFLPLAAWIIASRRGQWDQLLAATLVTVVIAAPVLFISALWEVFVAPHLLQGLIGY